MSDQDAVPSKESNGRESKIISFPPDMPAGKYRCRISDVKQGNGKYGPFLDAVFEVLDDGPAKGRKVRGFFPLSRNGAKSRQSKIARLAKAVLGKVSELEPKDLTGKELIVTFKEEYSEEIEDTYMKPVAYEVIGS